ncbi:MAG: hypothetical protein ACLTGJ_02380 [Faecalibacterium prausnitzii]
MNIALNKITGSWDEAKLADLIGGLDARATTSPRPATPSRN